MFRQAFIADGRCKSGSSKRGECYHSRPSTRKGNIESVASYQNSSENRTEICSDSWGLKMSELTKKGMTAEMDTKSLRRQNARACTAGIRQAKSIHQASWYEDSIPLMACSTVCCSNKRFCDAECGRVKRFTVRMRTSLKGPHRTDTHTGKREVLCLCSENRCGYASKCKLFRLEHSFVLETC